MSGDGRPQVRWQRGAPPREAPAETPPDAPPPPPPPATRPTWRRHWPQVAIAGLLALFLLAVGLASATGRLGRRSPATATSADAVPAAALTTGAPAATASGA